MILVDAIFVHTGGGKSILDYLISELNKTEVKVAYLLDSRYQSKVSLEVNDNVEFVAGFYNRYLFYRKNKDRITKVFCIGNLPPPIRLSNAYVITYLHSASYLDIVHLSVKERIIKYLKKKIFGMLISNSHLWIVQTDLMRKSLQNVSNISSNDIKILPFFKTVEVGDTELIKTDNRFFYPGTAETHKNHKRLIEGFCNFYDNFKTGSLYLTVEERFEDVFKYIELKRSQSYPIFNLGYIVKKERMAAEYARSEFLIFPSLQESFGLPLIEAIEFNCKIIASNYDYVSQVCEPSYVFDPKNINDISKAFENSLNPDMKYSYSKVNNEITEIINIIIR